MNMLLNDPAAAKKTIVEQSSGSTVISLGMMARVLYNNKDCRPYVSNKVGLNRIRQLQFFWSQCVCPCVFALPSNPRFVLGLIRKLLFSELYGGPSQPEFVFFFQQS